MSITYSDNEIKVIKQIMDFYGFGSREELEKFAIRFLYKKYLDDFSSK